MPPVARVDPSQDRAARSWRFAQVVLQIQADLASYLNLATGRVLVVADRKANPKAVAESHLRVRPLRRTGLHDPGSGRYADFKTRIVAVDIFVRSATDQASSDLAALTAEGVGLLEWDDNVIDCLDKHTPVRDGEPMTVHPMIEVKADDSNRPQAGDGFATETVYFEVAYVPSYHLDRT